MIYFLSIMDGEFLKIGYTGQKIEKRVSALQTGNPYKIEILNTVEGTLKEEKKIHRYLSEMFKRIKAFNNPINEWYPGKNPIIKTFVGNVKNHGIGYAIENIRSVVRWDLKVNPDEICSVRHLEKSLRKNGMSAREAKTFISKNKIDINELLKIKPVKKNPNVILRKAVKNQRATA